jgi:hypothetical protein
MGFPPSRALGLMIADHTAELGLLADRGLCGVPGLAQAPTGIPSSLLRMA